MKLEFIDTRDFYIPHLKKYHNGIALSEKSKEKVIEVTDTEAVWLLRMKNGNNPVFKKVENKPIKKETKIEGQNNDNR